MLFVFIFCNKPINIAYLYRISRFQGMRSQVEPLKRYCGNKIGFVELLDGYCNCMQPLTMDLSSQNHFSLFLMQLKIVSSLQVNTWSHLFFGSKTVSPLPCPGVALISALLWNNFMTFRNGMFDILTKMS
jgi:hypothetical protein